MAFFMVNSCKFRNCNLIFETLAELIQHVEETHIDLEKEDSSLNNKPQTVAMSKIFRFYGGAKPKKSLLAIATTSAKKVRQRTNSVMSTSASIRSLTPTSSEYDFEEEDINDNSSRNTLTSLSSELKETAGADQQWTNQLFLRMIPAKVEGGEDTEKFYVCPVKGCKKRYKNINGAKHHAKTAHLKDSAIRLTSKTKCFCGKSFQTSKQLDQHTEQDHALTALGIRNASSEKLSFLDANLSAGVKEESTLTSVASSTSTSKAQALSIVHPITISGGVLLTPARHLKAVSKGDILVAHKIANSSVLSKQTVASLVASSSSSLVTPPNTPQKRTMNLSLNNFVKPSSTTQTSVGKSDDAQKVIDEKVAQALAAVKQEMEAENALSKINGSLPATKHSQQAAFTA